MAVKKLLALLALKKVPHLGDSSIKKLIREVGSAEGVFAEKVGNLLKIEGIGAIKVQGLHNAQHYHQAEEEYRFIEDNGIKWQTYDAFDYPERLKHCIDAPVVLFSRGNIDIQSKRVISIVGTRKVTSYGVQFCRSD